MKNKIISLALIAVITILITGCDSSPSDALLTTIDDREITGKKEITTLIYDYYERAERNLFNDACNELETDSSNLIDKSVVSLAVENCGNFLSFNVAMQEALSKINADKSMNISFEDIDGSHKWKDKGFSQEEIKAYRGANFSLDMAVDNLKEWKKKGLRKRIDLALFIEADITPIEYYQWKEIGFERGLDLLMFAKRGYSPKEVKAFTTATKNNTWLLYGFTEETAKEWQEVGLEEGYIWLKEGYSLAEAKKWKEVLNIKNYRGTQQWLDIGLDDPSLIQKWIHATTVVNSRVIKGWIDAGASPEDAKKWPYGIYDAFDWYRVGATKEDVYKWEKAKFKNNVYNGYDWIEAGLTIEDVDKWQSAGIKNGALWVKAGLNIEGAQKWINSGIENGYSWKEAGLTIEDAKKWKQIDIYKPSDIDEWKNLGVESYESIGEWKGMRVKNAKEWILAGFNAKETKKWMESRVSPRMAKLCIETGIGNTDRITNILKSYRDRR